MGNLGDRRGVVLVPYPTLEISCKYMIVMTMEVLWGMRGGNMEIIVQGSVKVLDF